VTPGVQEPAQVVLKQTTYEGLETSCQRWHGDMTDIVPRSESISRRQVG
jgi:hypothetical protein